MSEKLSVTVENRGTPEYTIVEVGCGTSPFLLGPEHRQLEEGQKYIGVDFFNPSDVELLDKIIGPKGHLENADGRCLPFRSTSIDEVVMVNVAGFPKVHDSLKDLLNEAARVLKPTGLLTIVESYSPDHVPLAEIRATLWERRLLQVNKGQEHQLPWIRRYTNTNDPDSIICMFSFVQAPRDVKPYCPVPLQARGGSGSIVMELQAQLHNTILSLGEVDEEIAIAAQKLAEVRAQLQVALALASGEAALSARRAVAQAFECLETSRTMLYDGQRGVDEYKNGL